MECSRREFMEWICGFGVAVVGGWLTHRLLSLRSITRAAEQRGSNMRNKEEALFEAMHYEKLPGKATKCRLCFRECVIQDGKRGFCENRENRDGKLYTLVFNRPCALQIDPIEKEPLHHFLPGTTIFCLSTASCNYRCRFCQNWHLSYSAPEQVSSHYLTAADIVKLAKENNCPTISHTYAEPTVHYEYLLAVAREARKEKLRFIFHTNLGIMPEPLKEILPFVSGLSIDLKGFDPEYYRRMCFARLERVLENLKIVREAGTHFELVNLVLPTQNDSPEQVERMAVWVKENLGADTPLHFSRFFPTHRFRELPPTPVKTLERCQEIARKVGLNFVSIGNVPGHEANSTFCPSCGKRLIHRYHFAVRENLVKDGKCPGCNRKIPGVWS